MLEEAQVLSKGLNYLMLYTLSSNIFLAEMSQRKSFACLSFAVSHTWTPQLCTARKEAMQLCLDIVSTPTCKLSGRTCVEHHLSSSQCKILQFQGLSHAADHSLGCSAHCL
jgi:hypothetical protein